MSQGTRLALANFREGASVTAERKKQAPYYTLHGHDFYELDLILSGSGQTTLNNHIREVHAGQVFFLTPEDFHSFSNLKDMSILNLHFKTEAVPTEQLLRFTENAARIYTPSETIFSQILQLADAISSFSAEEHPNDEVLCRLLECILLLLSKDEIREEATDAVGMQRAVLYILAHFRENPSLGQIAAYLHLNERYFCKKFKEHTGKTYKDFLREKKLRYARRMVLATSLPITEIAAESGYTTLSHFNREFKDFFGDSPLILKKKYETRG